MEQKKTAALEKDCEMILDDSRKRLSKPASTKIQYGEGIPQNFEIIKIAYTTADRRLSMYCASSIHEQMQSRPFDKLQFVTRLRCKSSRPYNLRHFCPWLLDLQDCSIYARCREGSRNREGNGMATEWYTSPGRGVPLLRLYSLDDYH